MITKDDFEKYEKVREKGVCNMLDTKRIQIHSFLSEEKISLIRSNYDELKRKFEVVTE